MLVQCRFLSEQADAQAAAQKGSAVSAQGAQQGVSAVADAAGAVIQGNGVKGGFGGALQHAVGWFKVDGYCL